MVLILIMNHYAIWNAGLYRFYSSVSLHMKYESCILSMFFDVLDYHQDYLDVRQTLNSFVRCDLKLVLIHQTCS